MFFFCLVGSWISPLLLMLDSYQTIDSEVELLKGRGVPLLKWVGVARHSAVGMWWESYPGYRAAGGRTP